ncbi:MULTISPECIES: ATP-binding protein [unclassified Novosphingobium]|uniref:sensor histidine kinase n=1 Tax=unclassified Novosphingobium TaxID=2644732 RepID=UPI000EDD0D32|nr:MULTISPECIES: ATP-binding protein [unclassified Novosphingobium]HCF24145.1 sensor histidine kinase [Novosphingobium sp.]HQV04073.1 ATP-binding protein [Novosphingobium sp.]
MVEFRPRPSWKRRTSLTVRILAVNIIALGLMAGSLFYLDSYRNQLLSERFRLASAEAQIAAEGLAVTPPGQRPALMARIGEARTLRLRLYGPNGQLAADSFASGPSFALADPRQQDALIKAARVIDRAMNWVLGSDPIAPYRDPNIESASAWPELGEARASGGSVIRQRAAPDETPMINAAVPVGRDGTMLLSTRNAPDITQAVRDARSTLAIVLAVTLLISIQLSLFLARTIVQPLRALVRAAVRVRLGRDRAVEVPRLPERGDEIGLLARALSDMSVALRRRIDAVESFAADVAHEIKNPLASLRSAVESLEKVKDENLRAELTKIAAHDVRRIDRLVTEIAEASRIDAELSRTQFEPVDLHGLAESLIRARDERGENRGRNLRLASHGGGPWDVPGDAAQLARVLENLLDNAVSFSPEDGEVRILLERDEDRIVLSVIDQGLGIPLDARTKVFDRFHSLRPAEEDFGNHSGLGLAIARTIAEAHDGSLAATDRPDGLTGACLVLVLPALADEDEE